MARGRRLSYEITPGAGHFDHNTIRDAPYRIKLKVFNRVKRLFEDELKRSLGIAPRSASTVRGGWTGATNPSAQLVFDDDVDYQTLLDYAASLALIWRQDGLAVARFRPDGAKFGLRIRKSDRRRFSQEEIEAHYQALWRAAPNAGTVQAPNYDSPALGFTEHAGSLIFINNGKMPDDEWEKQLLNLLASTWNGQYDVEDLRVDFDLLLGGDDGGTFYKERLRARDRSDLLEWIDRHGRPAAEGILRDTDWTTGHSKTTKGQARKAKDCPP
jgi:hypothetical protein